MTEKEAVLMISKLYEFAGREIEGPKDGKSPVLEYVKKHWTKYDFEDIEEAVHGVVTEEKFLKNLNFIACIEERIKEKNILEDKDAEIIINKLQPYRHFKNPPEDIPKPAREIIDKFGGWGKATRDWENFEWFVRKAVESGVERDGTFVKDNLHIKPDRNAEKERLESSESKSEPIGGDYVRSKPKNNNRG